MALPPGSLGLPIAGETLAAVRDPFGFLQRRKARYGDTFKTHIAGRKVIVLSGIEGAEAFYDDGNIERSDAHPFLITDMFGGINFEMFDGPKHFALKSMALTAFDRPAVAGYLPDIQRLIESTLSRLANAPEFVAVAELRGLAIEAICWNVMGIPPGEDTAAITRDYGVLLAAVASRMPVQVPGTPYSRAMRARDRLLDRIRSVVAERRARPGADGLSTMLAAQAVGGRTYTDEEAVMEVHHMVIAGFIAYALMADVIRRLAEQPDLRKRCADEIKEHVSDGPLTLEALERLKTSTNVVFETKRLVPIVPLAFGKARRPFTCGGYEVPEGWRVYLALYLNNLDPATYPDPERFDPDRFAPERAEHLSHPMAFIPQGAEPPTGHRCLGLDYSTYLVLAFLAILVRGYEWELPPQDLAYDWTKRPPEPKSGLRVTLRAR